MKYLDEYRDGKIASALAAEIAPDGGSLGKQSSPRTWLVMRNDESVTSIFRVEVPQWSDLTLDRFTRRDPEPASEHNRLARQSC